MDDRTIIKKIDAYLSIGAIVVLVVILIILFL